MKFAAKIVFCYIFILGLAFTFLVPPLQKPDEHGHFLRAILLTHGTIIMTDKDIKTPIEKQYAQLIHDPHLNSIPYHKGNKFDIDWYNKPIFAGNDAFKLVNENSWGQFMLPAFSYIPHALGIAAASLLHLNAYIIFFAGRLTMFLLAFGFMIFIYRKTAETYKPLMLLVFSLPMVIHQITGYNYDAVQYMAGFALFVLITNLLNRNQISNRDLAQLCISFILFFISKLSFEPLLLLLFLIPQNKISKKPALYAKKFTFMLIFIFIIYGLLKSPFYLSASRYDRHPVGVSPVLQAKYITAHPVTYVSTFLLSSWNLKKFHFQGIVGIFGWLDYSMDKWIYAVYILAGVLVIFSKTHASQEKISKYGRILVLTAVFLTYTFIMTIFYLNWKSVGSSVIDGTQGRYFITLVPFTLLSVMRGIFKIPDSWINSIWSKAFFIVLLCMILVSIVNSIQVRYY